MTTASIAVWLSGNRNGVCGPIPKALPLRGHEFEPKQPPSKSPFPTGAFRIPPASEPGREPFSSSFSLQLPTTKRN
ncbi:hypothetical protein B0T18DRAFT_396107 [Schizothecium vesticola]|uniref:Uncharacterized protein n=1 Tax=Schizothecium vesticola TaxID=314040 RepID=A0AA40F8Q6_9PEZI|nr:hypothetical protein B0T18DRAFT_396107 [Schizothecium vesticola]